MKYYDTFISNTPEPYDRWHDAMQALIDKTFTNSSTYQKSGIEEEIAFGTLEFKPVICRVTTLIDATTGQNGVSQAKQFFDCSPLTGIVITKMDGTSKGGIILAIRDELGIPVRFIGLGEKMEDLEEFDLDKYLYGLCLGEEDEA